jgi:hypothetical protein
MAGLATTDNVLSGLKKSKSSTEVLAKMEKTLSVPSDKALIIIADFSGSMAEQLTPGATKIQALKSALINDLAKKLIGWTYGVIGFGINIFDPIKWLVYPTTDPRKMIAVNEYSANGSTPMYDGLIEAWIWTNRNASKARFILISDGEPTGHSKAEILEQCSQHKTIPIDTIGVGNGLGYDEEFLKQISEVTGGIFAKVNSIDNLTSTLIDLSPEKRFLLGNTK